MRLYESRPATVAANTWSKLRSARKAGVVSSSVAPLGAAKRMLWNPVVEVAGIGAAWTRALMAASSPLQGGRGLCRSARVAGIRPPDGAGTAGPGLQSVSPIFHRSNVGRSHQPHGTAEAGLIAPTGKSTSAGTRGRLEGIRSPPGNSEISRRAGILSPSQRRGAGDEVSPAVDAPAMGLAATGRPA